MIESAPPLILLPGMGADARMYREQKKVFPQLVVPDWIPPQRSESLSQYAARFAHAINPGRPFHLGGASFGGIIAREMARYLQPKSLFLISCGRSPELMTRWLQRVRSIAHLTRLLPWDSASLVAEVSLAVAGNTLPFRLRAVLKHLHHKETPFMKWSLHAILRWQPTPCNDAYPIHHLHGEHDPFFPAASCGATQIVPGAGHLLTKTHHDVVNRFIAERL